MLPYQMIAGGSFVSTGVAQELECISQNPPDLIIARNRTVWGDGTKSTQNVEFTWYRGMTNGSAQVLNQTTSTLALKSGSITTGGISCYSTINPPTFTALATTAITGSAGTYVVTMSNTGSIAVGDYVRLSRTTGELQLGGYVFQVTAVTANTSITLGYMASGGLTLAADATAGFVKKFIPNRMYPRYGFIANITQAAQAVVYFTAKNNFTPGEILGFRVSSDYGMSQINNREVRVLSVTNSSTVSSVTIDLDTTGYTAFAFPTSAVAAAGVSPAVAVPSASGVVPEAGSATIAQQPPGTNLRDAFDNRNTRLIVMGTGVVGTTADVIDWTAFKYDQFTVS